MGELLVQNIEMVNFMLINAKNVKLKVKSTLNENEIKGKVFAQSNKKKRI